MVNQLFEELAMLHEVEAIALGGSRAGESFDEKSDYDVYLYCTDMVSVEKRRELLSRYCTVMEIGNHFWEYEDNCTLKNGIDIDILYRNLHDFTADVADVVEKWNPHNGYTTCMWHNLRTCKVIYDKEGRLEAAKKRFDVSYPQKLKENIILHNMKLLHTAMPAYETQIAKAVKRRDLVSINHRTSAFLESYFDILFAVNEMTHPGEKRLIELSKKHCRILPAYFEENLNALFRDLFTNYDRIASDIQKLIMELEKVI